MDTFKLVIAGVGGQGTLLASRLLAEAGIKSGLTVKIGETYGMAQRGGPVVGMIQIGGEASNPQIRKGEADVLLAFEPAEGVRRGATYLKDDGLALINSRITPPVEVISGLVKYPDMIELLSLLNKITSNIICIDATGLAEKAGDPITTNVVMIGALSASNLLPFNSNAIKNVLKDILRPKYLQINIKAFDNGFSAYLHKISERNL